LVFRSGKNFAAPSRAQYFHAELEDTLNTWFTSHSCVRSAGLISPLPESASCSCPAPPPHSCWQDCAGKQGTKMTGVCNVYCVYS